MRFLAVSFFTFLLFACKSKDPDILPPAKMQAVLWDMIRAGEFINGFVVFKDSFSNMNELNTRWYEKVYQIHKITEQQFKKSYAYYREHPTLIRPMLDSLAKKAVPAITADSTAGASTGNTGVDSSIRKNPGISPETSKRLDSLRKARMINRRPQLDTNRQN